MMVEPEIFEPREPAGPDVRHTAAQSIRFPGGEVSVLALDSGLFQVEVHVADEAEIAGKLGTYRGPVVVDFPTRHSLAHTEHALRAEGASIITILIEPIEPPPRRTSAFEGRWSDVVDRMRAAPEEPLDLPDNRYGEDEPLIEDVP